MRSSKLLRLTLATAMTCILSMAVVDASAAPANAPDKVDESVVQCLVANLSWLQTMPDDPIEFFGDLCPKSVDSGAITSSVRIDSPDISPRTAPAASPPLRLAFRKAGLQCLSKNAASIVARSFDLNWDQDVITSIRFGTTKLDLTNCTMSKIAATTTDPNP